VGKGEKREERGREGIKRRERKEERREMERKRWTVEVDPCK